MSKSPLKSPRSMTFAALSFGALLGCAPPGGVDDTIALTAGALLGNNDPTNAVTTTTDHSNLATILGTRLGNGANSASLIRYKRGSSPSSPWAIDPALTVGSVASSQRPFTWWEQPRSAVTMLTVDPADLKIKDVAGELVFPNATAAAAGPATAIETFLDRRDLAFARFSDGTFRQSKFTGSWTDTPLTIGAVNPPNAAPFAAGRDQISDSLWYTCGPATGTMLCEHRIGPPGSAQDGLEFTTDFGAGTFIDGTHPSALVEQSTTRRWIFAAVATSAGPKGIYSRRDFTPGATGFNFNALPLQTIESSSTATFSSPMPIRVGGTFYVFYFRTDTGATTKLMRATWNATTNSAWDPPQVVHEVAMAIPAGNDPTPYLAGQQGPLQVAFRLPFSSGVRDVVNLAATSTGFLKQLLPGPSYRPGLFAMSASRFSSVDLGTGTATQVGPAVWPSTTAFTSNRVGLGYAVQNGPLFEVNFNDGGRRLIGTQQFTNATTMTLNGSTLYIVQSNKLWNVDLASGAATDAGLDMTGVTSMATSQFLGPMFLRNGSLYKVSDPSKALGSPGAWAANATLAATAQSQTMLINQPGAGLFAVALTSFDSTNGVATPVRASANLVAQPAAFDDAAWTKTRTTIVANTGPKGLDNTFTADLLREDTTKSRHSMEQIVAVDPTRIYTWSVYVQPSGRTFFNLVLTTPEDPNSGVDVVFDLSQRTVTYAAGVGTGALISASAEPAGGSGWTRVTITGKPGGSGSGVRAMAYLMSSGSVGTYTGNGTSGVYLWGGELKLANDFATPNQVVDADDPSKATWHKNRASVVSDVARAPNAAFPAYRLVEDTTTGTHYLDQFVTADATRPATWSLYLKANGRTQGSLYLTTPSDSSNGASMAFDLVAKTAVCSKSGTGTCIGGQLVDVGNGWFRASVTGTATNVPGNQVRAVLYPSNGSGQGYLGDGSSGFFVWRGELRGMLDPALSSPITSVVDVPASCNPGDTTCADALYVLRASGQLGKLTNVALSNDGVGFVAGTTLDYQNLGAATWAAGTLLAPRNY